MRNIIFTFGAISGAVGAGTFILGTVLAMREGALGRVSGALGYLLMLVALSIIFIGIKRYRDRELGGAIRFGQAFLVGLAISAVAGISYIVCWEIYLGATGYTFIDEYPRGVIEGKKAEGMAGEELEALIVSMETLKQRLANPAFRLVMGFLEVFPFGIIVSLISAATLRNSGILPAPTALAVTALLL